MPLPVLTAEERAAGQAARDAWTALGLPPPTARRCDLARFYIATPDAERYALMCHSPADKSAGCLSWKHSAHFFAPRAWPVVVVSPRHHSEPTIIVHELLHAHVRCAALGVSAWDPGDRMHANPRVWQAAGGNESVQVRANALMGY